MKGVPGKRWTGIWFDPRTGAVNASFALTTDSTDSLVVPARAGALCMMDWAAVLKPAVALKDNTVS